MRVASASSDPARRLFMSWIVPSMMENSSPLCIRRNSPPPGISARSRSFQGFTAGDSLRGVLKASGGRCPAHRRSSRRGLTARGGAVHSKPAPLTLFPPLARHFFISASSSPSAPSGSTMRGVTRRSPWPLALRQALALEPERPAARRIRRDRHLHFSGKRRHGDFRAEHRLVETDRQVEAQIRALRLEERMRHEAHA